MPRNHDERRREQQGCTTFMLFLFMLMMLGNVHPPTRSQATPTANATTAGACTGPNQFIDFFGRCQQVYGARGYNSPMDHSDPEHMKHMTSEQNKRGKAVFWTFGMLIFVQVIAVISVVHLRRRAAARQAAGNGSGGWSQLNNVGDSSDDEDADTSVPEMEGMGGLPSYDDSEKVYAPPSYAGVVVATPIGGAVAGPPTSPAPPFPSAVAVAASGISESRA